MQTTIHQPLVSSVEAAMRRSVMLALIALVTMLGLPALVAAQGTEEIRYYHTDAIGSVRLVTNEAGQVVANYDYLPFGEPWQPPAQPETRRFGGKERDSETGLDYVGARYYASGNGRFTTPDPVLPIEDALLDPQRWNRYTYVMNRPLALTHPDGRCPQCLLLAQRLALQAAQLASRYGTQAYNWATRFFNSPTGQEVTTAAGEIITGAQAGPTSGLRIIPSGDIDVAATALARRLGGQASVLIEGFGNREFDVISDAFIGQTFGGQSALLKPDNFLSAARREQIRQTLEAAKTTGRKAYFEFRSGVHDDVLDFIRRNAERIGAEFDVYR